MASLIVHRRRRIRLPEKRNRFCPLFGLCHVSPCHAELLLLSATPALHTRPVGATTAMLLIPRPFPIACERSLPQASGLALRLEEAEDVVLANCVMSC